MTYVPTFEPSDVPCELLTYVETRSRNLLGQIYFRSKECGLYDDIVIICTVEQQGQYTENVSLTYTFNSITYGPYTVVQQFDDINNTYLTDSVEELRNIVNNDDGPLDMTSRGVDVHDIGQDPDHIVDFSGSLVGGSSGPTNDAVLTSIRTGPKYSLIGITSTEDEHGNNITPTNKIRQWSGTEWIVFEE